MSPLRSLKRFVGSWRRGRKNCPQRKSRRLQLEALESRTLLSVFADFNGDGYGDLAIGSPHEDVTVESGVAVNAGRVYVTYGSPDGLTAGGQVFSQEDLGGGSESDDYFGHAFAVGDFNGDGYSDLAIGSPGEDLGDIVDAGRVYVLFGSADGLTTAGSQAWTQDSPGVLDTANWSDRFGAALAAGDFNGDSRDDLAIGVPGETLSWSPNPWTLVTVYEAGAVNVLYGSASGLTDAGNQFWHQNSTSILDSAEAYDHFGASLAVGDFNNDGKDDLAIGVPDEDVVRQGFSYMDAGAVHVIYGKAGVGLHHGVGDGMVPDNRFFHQDTSIYPTDDSRVETGDRYGFSLAVGDFNNNGKDDLAVGAPFENIGLVADAGAINVIYFGVGSSGVLDRFLYQGSDIYGHEVPGYSQANDRFGYALAAASFNGQSRESLAIGVPGENLGSGAVIVLQGQVLDSDVLTSGLGAHRAKYLTQDSDGVVGVPEAGDGFGSSLTAGDFDGDSQWDLAVGVPGEDTEGAVDAGIVQVLYGDHGWISLDSGRSQTLWQSDFGHVSEDDDRFGFSLA